MRRAFCVILSFVLFAGGLRAQSVGLVLSGGGAKGITHIGIIQALEENGIPIDYIAGTSIGAVVGGLYAMGYTPQEMLELINSKEFKQCYSGEVDKDNTYYIKQNDPTPELYAIKGTWGDSKFEVKALPQSLIDPIYMNIKIMELCIQATAACKEDFDSLFVPFRCVAADVYNKKELVFSQGDLGNSVRASMTFPFVFRPIKMGNTLAYDGGLYNNFPTDVMKKDFAPDYIIGSVVSSNKEQSSDASLVNQVENLIMHVSNYELPDTNGILMDFDLENEVGLLDFDKAQQLFDLGYNTTMCLIDSIKGKVTRTISQDSVNNRRKAYKQTLPEMIFGDITVSGSTPKQHRYVINEILPRGHKYVRFKDFKKAYFRLMSENAVKEIFPTAKYDPQRKIFDLHLDVSMKDNFEVAFGGGLSTDNVNQIYYGLNYNHIGRHSTEVLLNGQFGRTYNNVQLMGRINLSTNIPISVRTMGSHSTLDYFRQNSLFSGNADPALNKQVETFGKVKVALPFMTRHKAEFGVGYGQITDSYVKTAGAVDFKNLEYHRKEYHLWGGSVLFKRNSLNTHLYATKGGMQQVLAQIFTGKSFYTPYSEQPVSPVEEDVSWLQIGVKNQHYLPLGLHMALGTYFEGYYSSRNLAHDYTASMLQAGVFAPTPNMLFAYNPTFRANQYFAAGLKPIYMFNPYLQLRLEAYAFVPLYPIQRTEEGGACYGRPFSTLEHVEELSLVGRFSTFVVSAYLNYNSSDPKNVNVGITLGWHMMNNRFIEQ